MGIQRQSNIGRVQAKEKKEIITEEKVAREKYDCTVKIRKI